MSEDLSLIPIEGKEFIYCTKRGKKLQIPPRTDEDIEHIKEVEDGLLSLPINKELDDGIIMFLRMIHCLYCNKILFL